MRNCETVVDLCGVTCDQIRELTGFERVVAYFFDQDWNGTVIAESRAEGVDSFLGLHFPSSDIPSQARALYELSWLRLIPDVLYRASAIFPDINPRSGKPLDLSYSILRSVSPFHIEYLKNMGLSASMSLSLMKGERLWGLISCAGVGQAHFVPFETRNACEFLAEVTSSLLGEKIQRGEFSERLAGRQLLDELLIDLSSADDFIAKLSAQEEKLLALVDANGAIISFRDNIHLVGSTPDKVATKALIEWLDKNAPDRAFDTNMVKSIMPSGVAGDDVCGILSIPLSKSIDGQYLIWLRPEFRKTVNWGGNPDKPTEASSPGELHPRKSFELWQEIVKNRSVAWSAVSVETARALQRGILEQILERAEKVERLNAELKRSNFELDSFAYAASHDLKEPVRGIHNFAEFLLDEPSISAKGIMRVKTIHRLTERMESLLESLLDYSQIGRAELALEWTDLNDVVLHAEEFLARLIAEKNAVVRYGQLGRVRADRIRLVQVFTNVISNAIKYNSSGLPNIEIGLRDASDKKPVIFIKDNGIGIPESQKENVFKIFKRLHARDAFGGGSGTGLTIAKAIVERHGGR
ncbi:MAG: GAF domain-containing protein, partial [Proteobacteria bacterium]